MAWVLAAVLPLFCALAYVGSPTLPFLLCGSILLAAGLSGTAARRWCPLDLAVVLVSVYEISSLLLSKYQANGFRAGATLASAALSYMLVRLVARGPSHAVLMASLIGAGGVALAGFALTQFGRQLDLVRANGLGDIVAFRARLIIPPAPWVLGEWFTLVLLTLPFAFGVPVFLWFGRRRILATVAALMATTIIAGLLLSCSRAVFWALIVFAATTVSMAVVYRLIRAKGAVAAFAGVLGVLGLVLAIENAFYPGVAEAYVGRQISQARSTEGRFAIWRRSADIFTLAPLWGVGSGNAPLFLTASADEDQTTGFASRTFSLPIQVLTEKGAVGAALYLVLLVLAAWESHRTLRNPMVSLQMKGLTCCLVAGVVAVLFRDLTYSSLLEHAATVMLFAMALALFGTEEPK